MNDPDASLGQTGDPADPPVHHVAFPMGTEGPFTLAELRGLLVAGRLQPDDRVMREGPHATRLVVDLIPDARAIAAKTDRSVRRRSSTSGVHEARKPGTGSEARRFRTPLPVPAATEAAPAPAGGQVDAPSAPIAPAPSRLPRLLLALVLLVAACAWLGWMLQGPGGPLRPEPPPQPVVSLRFDRIGDAGGPWVLDLFESTVVVTAPDGKQHRATVVRTSTAKDHDRLQLTPPHPVLGPVIELHGSNPVTITTDGGSGSAAPAP